jgi:UDP-N-acetyl-2-amino-2-deoxyglucuronate dehydrogenase
MTNFALIGSSGYVASKHAQAIKELGHQIIAAVDPNPTGALDRYFPRAEFFSEVDDLLSVEWIRDQLDYAVLCSPSHLHFFQADAFLDYRINVISEKPICLWSDQMRHLSNKIEQTGANLFGISQLRYHPGVQEIRNMVKLQHSHHTVKIEYITPRGDWYKKSWKGNPELSGGIGTNIGYHLFDLLMYMFGGFHIRYIGGTGSDYLVGDVYNDIFDAFFTLSTDMKFPRKVFDIGGVDLDLTKNTEGLYEASYSDILNGGGISFAESIPTLKFCEEIRHATEKCTNV